MDRARTESAFGRLLREWRTRRRMSQLDPAGRAGGSPHPPRLAAGRRGPTTPGPRGKRTMVWQTGVTDDAGRLLSLTIQTQMVLA